MPRRKNISIKTNYESKVECINSLIDYNKKTFLSLYVNQISGMINESGEFEISSRYKLGALFTFTGSVTEVDDNVYLEGDIKVKRLTFWCLLLASLFIFPISLVYILAWGGIGILFMILIVVDISLLWWFMLCSDALYHDVISRLDDKTL